MPNDRGRSYRAPPPYPLSLSPLIAFPLRYTREPPLASSFLIVVVVVVVAAAVVAYSRRYSRPVLCRGLFPFHDSDASPIVRNLSGK